MLTRKGTLQQAQEAEEMQAMYEAMYKTMEMQRATGATFQSTNARVYNVSLLLGPNVVRQTKIMIRAKEHEARIGRLTKSVRENPRKVKLTPPAANSSPANANPPPNPVQPVVNEPAQEDVGSWVDSLFV